MASKKRRLLIVLCVIVGLVIVATVALRLVLTKERLLALVVPRIEKTVQADVHIGDIGIRFPFGFGVDVRDVSFRKPLPENGSFSFESRSIVVRASLISLIRRRPEIKDFEVRDARVVIVDPGKGVEIRLGGLETDISVSPTEEGYSIRTAVKLDSVTLDQARGPKTVSLEDIRFDGLLGSNRDFSSLHITESKLGWSGLLDVLVSGDVTDLKGRQVISMRMSSESIPLAPLVEELVSLDLVRAAAVQKRGAGMTGGLPVEVLSGDIGFDMQVAGSMREPAGIGASGDMSVKNVSLKLEKLDRPVAVNGAIAFTDRNIEGKGFTIGFGATRADAGFGVSMDQKRKVERVRFEANVEADLAETAALLKNEAVSVTGAVSASFTGGGQPAVLSNLFPSGPGELTPEGIAAAWKQVDLAGTVTMKNIGASTAGSPLAVSSLNGEARLLRGSIEKLTARFSVNGSSFTSTATLRDIMPAMAELSRAIDPKRPPADIGKVLDSFKNVPDISVDVEAPVLDVRPFERAAAARKEAAGIPRGDAGTMKAQPAQPIAANPVAVLFLKNTFFTARVDSVIASKGVFTTVAARGTVQNAVLTADPVTLGFAGGTGNVSLVVNMRRPDRVSTRAKVSFEGIEAGRALAGLHSFGSLIEGRFSFNAKGGFESGAGLNPLMTLSGDGSALSSGGRVNIEPFISSLSAMPGLDLSALKRFDFREWSGRFLVKEGRLVTDDWKILSSAGNWLIKGSFGFDGTLDYAAKLVIPPDVQSGMKDLDKFGDLVALFRDEAGNVVFDFGVGGSSKSPRLSLDTERAKKKAEDKAVESIIKKARDWLKK